MTVQSRLQRVAEHLDDRRSKRARTFVPIPTRLEVAARASLPVHPLQRGHAIFDNLRAKLATYDTTTSKYRSYNQMLIHTLLASSLARHVYGSMLDKFEDEIKRYNGWTTVRQEIAITMPRRSGKSTAVGTFIAAAMLTVPGFNCACFAASARSAGKDSGMFKIVRGALRKHFKYEKRPEEHDNAETLEVIIDGDKREFHSYPGGLHTLRGVGGNFIVVEESSYIKDLAYFEVIVPLLALDNVAFVALSTLGEDTEGWFNRLIESGDVESFVVMYVCEACVAKGKIDPCVHNEWMVPQWSNSERMETQKKFYGEAHKETFLRESVGLVRDETDDRVFSHIKIRDVVAAPPVDFLFAVRQIFITIDPVAGTEIREKNLSDFAVIAIASPGTVFMGGLALNIVETEEYRKPLHEFLTRLRSHELTKDATLVIDVESGTGLTAPDVYAWAADNFRNIVLVNDMDRKQGTLTTNKTKQEMMELTRLLLHKGEIGIWRHFVSDIPTAVFIDKWAKQMNAYKRIFVKGQSITSKNTCIYSGKGENKDKLDDVCVTFQRAVRLRDRFETDRKLRSRAFL